MKKPECARWKIAVRKCDVLVAVGISMQSGKQINIKMLFFSTLVHHLRKSPRPHRPQILAGEFVVFHFHFASQLQQQKRQKIKETCRKLHQTIKMHSCALTLRYL